MIIDTNENPSDPQLKEWFSWRSTAVTEHQQKELINKFGNEIVLHAKFLACLNFSEKPEKAEDGRALVKKGTKVTYYTLTAKDGKKYYPVFTDREELARWESVKGSDPMTALVTFDDFRPILAANPEMSGVVVNPFTDNFIMLRPVVDNWSRMKDELIRKAKAEAGHNNDNKS